MQDPTATLEIEINNYRLRLYGWQATLVFCLIVNGVLTLLVVAGFCIVGLFR